MPAGQAFLFSVNPYKLFYWVDIAIKDGRSDSVSVQLEVKSLVLKMGQAGKGHGMSLFYGFRIRGWWTFFYRI